MGAGTPERKEEDLAVGPASLYFNIAAIPHTLGDLIDHANGMSPDLLTDAVVALARSIEADTQANVRPERVKRRLVIMGAMIHRILFELENLPMDRDFLL